MDSLFNRLVAIALIGLMLPVLTYWIPNASLSAIVEIVLGVGLLAGVLMAVVFVISTLWGGAVGGTRRR